VVLTAAGTVATGGSMRTEAAIAPHRLRRLYLDDHLALAEGWLALARRVARANAGSDLGADLHELINDLVHEPAMLHRLLSQTGGRPHRLKQQVARMAERLGRLKPNGALLRYSPLSRVVELELLSAALLLRATMWDALVQAFGPGHPICHTSLRELADRAHRQMAWVEPHLAAARRALG
jgi:hypothetical protein